MYYTGRWLVKALKIIMHRKMRWYNVSINKSKYAQFGASRWLVKA